MIAACTARHFCGCRPAFPKTTEEALAPEMAEVLLEVFNKHHVSSADPIWSRIDELATKLREAKREGI